MQNAPIEVEYSYQIQDFEDITHATYKKNPKWREMRVGYFGLGIAILVAPFLAGPRYDDPDKFLLGMSVMGALLIYCGFQSPAKRARKQYANAIQSYSYKAIISESGVTTMSPTVRTEMQWTAFSSFLLTEGVLALFYESVMYLFPRRAFSDRQWQLFVTLIEENVGKAG